MAIKHSFVSAIPDGADTSVVRPTDWNADHSIDDNTITEAKLLIADNTTLDVTSTKHGFVPKAPADATKFLNGAATAAFALVKDSDLSLSDITTNDFSTTKHGFVPKGPNTGKFLKDDGTWGTPAGGSSTWDTIGAAAGDATTSNTTNRIVYQTAPTADSRIAWNFTESSAATNGTSSSGVPNQVLLQLDTLAASTQSPLKVSVRGTVMMAASPNSAQLLFNDNGTTSAPNISSFGGKTSGFYFNGADTPAVSVSGTRVMQWGSVRVFTLDGTTSVPALTNLNDGTSGIGWTGTTLRFIASAQVHTTAAIGTFIQFKGTDDAVGFEYSGKKSRGTVNSPSVITTGDDLLTISGYGYVGGTNTYREAARITFDSVGTISDATNGIGGIIRFSTNLQGTDTAVQERWRIEQAGWLVGQEFATDPGTSVLTAGADFAMYRKNDKLVFAHNVAGTINYLTIPLDGSSTAWTQGTTAP